MGSRDASVLFLGKQHDEHVDKALRFCEKNFGEVTAHLGKWGDPRPASFETWTGDYVFSYLSRWVVPAPVLERTDIAALNFHPASPEYPGIGCTNFALYEGAEDYGVTCHHMEPSVDTGEIVAVRRFPVFDADTVASLLSRAYDLQLSLFYEIVGHIIEGQDLPSSPERWSRPPFSRAQFEELRRVTPEMSAEEVARRVRATTYDGWRPQVELHGYVFELKRE